VVPCADYRGATGFLADRAAVAGSTLRRGFAIVPDVKWPDMYRLRSPDGALTDLTNITRARDALTELAHSFEETT
jgi:hypothetical protein